MRTVLWIFVGLLLFVGGIAGGIYLTGGRAALERIAAGDLPATGAAPAAEAATTPPSPSPSSAATPAPPLSSAPAGNADDGGKILFYRDPMGLPEISTTPKKDWMGMDYLPVYDTPTGAPAAAETGGKGKILYYRNPMGLPDVSYEPKKDSMGMDYIPVYENEAGDEGNVVRISLDKVQKLGVRTAAAAVRTLARAIRATGTIQPDESRQVIVTSRFDGWVQRLDVDKTGDAVERGQIMLELVSPELQLAQQEYIRQKSISPNRAEAAAQHLKTLGLSNSQISALDELKHTTPTVAVAAPADGQVVEKMAIQGARVAAGEPLYRLVDFSHVWVIAEVYEQDLPMVQIGQAAEVELDAFPGERFRGEVSFIYPTLTAATRTAKVRVELDNPDGRLKANMFAAVQLSGDMSSTGVLSVPDSAVLDTGKRQTVLVERGEGRYEPREVRVGRRADGYVEILGGVAKDEKVVVSANFLIDAESNLQSALKAFTAGDQPAAETKP
jgi:membrane fusion protein, copper/silver efflux system